MKIGYLSIVVAAAAILLTACGSNSSPEGRMTMKIETLQKELLDIQKQNKAILDSIASLQNNIQQWQQCK